MRTSPKRGSVRLPRLIKSHVACVLARLRGAPQEKLTPDLYSFVGTQVILFWVTLSVYIVCFIRAWYLKKYASQRAARAAQADRIRKLEEEDRKLKEKAREEEEAVRQAEAVRAASLWLGRAPRTCAVAGPCFNGEWRLRAPHVCGDLTIA